MPVTAYPPNILNAACPSRQVIELLANKWTLLVLAAITRGTNRHNALRREVDGISQKMLAQTLRALERDGLLTRRVFPVVPPRVEYDLTPLGQSLTELIANLGAWAEQHYAEVEQARAYYESALPPAA